jgi:hypothetical protein
LRSAGIKQEREVIHKIARELSRTHAFILAGGKGERLQPITATRPKLAVSFGGWFRIIDFTLSNCLHSDNGGVKIPAGFRQGLHFKNDHNQFVLTESGILIISKTRNGTPPVLHSQTKAAQERNIQAGVVDRTTEGPANLQSSSFWKW